MSRFEPTDTDMLLLSLCDAARAGVRGPHVMAMTRKPLYERRYVIQGTRRLSNFMHSAVSRVEHDTVSRTERSIPVLIRNRWFNALSGFANAERRRTLVEYLQGPPPRLHRARLSGRAKRCASYLRLGLTPTRSTCLQYCCRFTHKACASAGPHASIIYRRRREPWSWRRSRAVRC